MTSQAYEVFDTLTAQTIRGFADKSAAEIAAARWASAAAEFERVEREHACGVTPGKFRVREPGEFLGEAMASVTQIKPDPFKSDYGFKLLTPEAFASGEQVEPQWQIHELVPRVGTGLDTGKSGALKSFDLLDRATHIQLGRPYCGRPVEKGRAVCILAEDVFGSPDRWRALAKHMGCSLADMPAVVPMPVNLYKPDQVTELINLLRAHRPTFIWFDTKWRCTVGASEDSASDAAVIFGSLDRIARELNCFVTAVAHTGYEGTRARGSSAQFAAVDVEVFHEINGDFKTSTVTKLKSAPDGAKFTFKRKFVELGISRKTGKPYGSLVLECITDAPVVKAKGRPLTGMPKLVLDTLTTLAPVGTCGYETLLDAVRDKLPAEKPDNRRKTVKQAVTRLIASGRAFMHSDDRIGSTAIKQDKGAFDD